MTETEKLIELLGSESSSKWIDFMDYIHDHLAQILRRGKPKKSDIENSIIGKAGFSSWSEMVEAPTLGGGLGWNVASFDSWKRAYNLVLEFEYLRNLELSASAINTIYRETKPDFPKSETDFKSFQEQRAALQEEKQQHSLKDAQNRTQELTEQNKRLNQDQEHNKNQMAALQEQIAQSARQLLVSEKRVSELETLLSVNKKDLQTAKQELQNKSRKLSKFQNMSWLEKSKSIF